VWLRRESHGRHASQVGESITWAAKEGRDCKRLAQTLECPLVDGRSQENHVVRSAGLTKEDPITPALSVLEG
jgi:hypothetical protein